MIRLLLRVGSNPLPQEFADDAITIGRAPTNHLVIGDPRVSRLHARIQRVGDEVQVVDLESGNGTRLNGEKIESEGLQVGDVLTIGPTCLRVAEIDVSGLSRIPVVAEVGSATTTVRSTALRRAPRSFRKNRRPTARV